MCHHTVPQSTSQMTARPPGRRARWISASAAGRVGDVLHHLHAQRGVEVAVVDGKRGGVAVPERHVVVALAALAGETEHVGAGVDRHDGAVRPHLVEQLPHVEPGPTADVEDPFAGRGGQRLAHVPPAADHVALVVGPLEGLSRRGVEGDLGHDRRRYRRRSGSVSLGNRPSLERTAAILLRCGRWLERRGLGRFERRRLAGRPELSGRGRRAARRRAADRSAWGRPPAAHRSGCGRSGRFDLTRPVPQDRAQRAWLRAVPHRPLQCRTVRRAEQRSRRRAAVSDATVCRFRSSAGRRSEWACASVRDRCGAQSPETALPSNVFRLTGSSTPLRRRPTSGPSSSKNRPKRTAPRPPPVQDRRATTGHRRRG